MNIFYPKPSERWLIQQIPNDGCLIVFNGKSNNWRARATEMGVLRANKISDNIVSMRRGNHNDECDLYISWKEDK